jgi:hypothetical protein
MSQPFSLKISALVLSLVVLQSEAKSALAQPVETNGGTPLMEQLKLLGQSDADNNIDRRTEFVIELYGNNSEGLTAQNIRQVYDDAFSAQMRQNQQQAQAWRLGLGILGLVVLGIGTLVVVKRRILKVKTVKAQIPWVGEVQFEAAANARQAAWQLYVEMKTRIATQKLADDEGLLREALDSLYKLFELTREILKEAGPDVGASPQKSVGGIAIALLNEGLRPFMAKWHPRLKSWEAGKPADRSDKEHENLWPEEAEMRRELGLLSVKLDKYTHELAKVAGTFD